MWDFNIDTEKRKVEIVLEDETVVTIYNVDTSKTVNEIINYEGTPPLLWK